MVRFQILSGRQAGRVWNSRRFPVSVGRAPGRDLQLEEPGVWDDHFHLDLNPGVGFILQACPDALVSVNGQPLQHAVLRNGDVVEIGGAKLRFWLTEAPRRNQAWAETLVWMFILAATAAQVYLIYRFSR
ncbi:MAG: FHA domain-containing protein [Verrucomicrobiota bacterium]